MHLGCRTTIFTGRPAVFASRAAKPECRTTIFTGRPRTVYYFTILFALGSKQEVFASRAAKPECWTTIFTGRPAAFASRAARSECRTTIFTSRPDRLLFYFRWVQSRRFLHLGPQNLHVRPPFHRSADRFLFYCFTIPFPLGLRQVVFTSRAAKPECRTSPRRFLHLGQHVLHVGSRFGMSAKRIPAAKIQPDFCSNPSELGVALIQSHGST